MVDGDESRSYQKYLEGFLSVVTQTELLNIIIKGRNECYIKKNYIYNPYVPGDVYDWHSELEHEQYIFTDSYRGSNPYSGVEYIYIQGHQSPIWSCDYVGYALENSSVAISEIYGFLKKARASHLSGCGGNLITDYSYINGKLSYQTTFSGTLKSILQIEEIHYCDSLVGRQVSAGYFKE